MTCVEVRLIEHSTQTQAAAEATSSVTGRDRMVFEVRRGEIATTESH